MAEDKAIDQPAEVIDISPITCPACRSLVDLEDAFCGGCGANLLETKPLVCAHCGRALTTQDAFCRSCGEMVSAAIGSTIDQSRLETDRFHPVDVDPVSESASAHAEARSRRWPIAVAVFLSVLVAVAATWYFLFKGPNLRPFDRALHQAVAAGAALQEVTDELDDPGRLESFETEVSGIISDLNDVTVSLPDAEEYEAALQEAVDAEIRYAEELVRLAGLPSADADESQYLRAPELAGVAEDAIAAAAALRGEDVSFARVDFTPTPVTATLSRLAEYRERVVRQREKIRTRNKERAEQLQLVTVATDAIDGVLGRYSEARADLASWIEGVDSHGASFMEAYDVLAQHADLRRQYRDELTAIEAPDPFGTDKAALLAVMDTAIGAMDDASRGIAEYQYNFRYSSYDDTPGWRSFEEATDRISESYSTAVSVYETRKAELLDKLSEKIALPELPD